MTKNKTQLHRATQGALPIITAGMLAVGALTLQASTDYGPAIWRPACSGHWNTSGSGHKFLVIHDMEGYYAYEVSTSGGLRSCSTTVSVHYGVNGKKDTSSDYAAGEVTQFVSEAYYAWHAKCWNGSSAGTEHEGFRSNPAWYTAELYSNSALLQRHLADHYGIAKDRNHIVGHDAKSSAAWVSYANANLGINASCNTHDDPGPYWDWTGFMNLINASATSHEYYGIRLGNGLFQAKDGISGLWNDMLSGTTAIQMEGARLAGVAGGTLYGKDSFGATWSSLIGNVSKFQLKGNRIGVLGTDGTLLAKDGLGGTWATLVGGVSSFQLDGNRIGAMTGNTLIVKDGLGGTWSTLTGNDVSRFKLNGNRIAILTTSGTLLAKDTLGGTWSSLLANVTDFDLTGDRIAAISGGALLVKDGLGGTWSTLTGTDIVKLKISGNRITAVNQAGSLLAKDGVSGVWYTEIGGVSDFLLDGDRIGVLGTDGTFNVKYGLTGTWSTLATSVANITMTSTQ